MLKKIFLLGCAFVLITGCSTMMLKPADFSWSFESVLKTDSNGMVKGEPKTLSFGTKALFFTETGDSISIADKTIRIIRDRDGFYFITSPGFKNVYIFSAADGALSLHKTVLLNAEGLTEPAFNRRDKGIELANHGAIYLLNKNGLITEK